MDVKIQNRDIFFTRPHSKTFFDKYVPEISHHINLNNLFFTNKRITSACFDAKNHQDFLAYRFYLLKEWIIKNEKYTIDFIKKLDYLIGKLYLWNELNSFERQWIVNTNDIVFAKTRNLKSLTVDFKVNKKENIVFKYNNIKLFFITKNKKIKVISNCVLHISNQRIIITKDIENFSLQWSQIKSYHFSTEKISLTSNLGQQYFLSSHNNYILHVSFCRIFEIIKK